MKPMLKMLRFEVHVCDHCNLNCKGCGHFAPVAEKNFVNTAVLERDFMRLSELTGRKCETVDLMGGEPLLHPEIMDIFRIARKYFDTPIQVITNGILLAGQPDEFWRSCEQNHITVVISVYPVEINIEKIKAQALNFNVKLEMRPKFGEEDWHKSTIDIYGGQNIETAYDNCISGGTCLFLQDGRLAPCSRPLLSKHINNYFSESEYKFSEPSEEDFIDIFKANSLFEILEKFTRPIPYCRYCKTDNRVYTKWDLSKKQIGEWL